VVVKRILSRLSSRARIRRIEEILATLDAGIDASLPRWDKPATDTILYPPELVNDVSMFMGGLDAVRGLWYDLPSADRVRRRASLLGDDLGDSSLLVTLLLTGKLSESTRASGRGDMVWLARINIDGYDDEEIGYVSMAGSTLTGLVIVDDNDEVVSGVDALRALSRMNYNIVIEARPVTATLLLRIAGGTPMHSRARHVYRDGMGALLRIGFTAGRAALRDAYSRYVGAVERLTRAEEEIMAVARYSKYDARSHMDDHRLILSRMRRTDAPTLGDLLTIAGAIDAHASDYDDAFYRWLSARMGWPQWPA